MDKQYYEIYRELSELYRAQMSYPPFPLYLDRESRRALAIVAEAVEESARVLPEGQRLRPDARLFLIVNLHQMVAQPLAHPDSPVKLDGEVEEGLKKDAKDILRDASESAAGRDEIPASHVLWSTAKVLDKLNLKSWRLWERD